MTRAAAGSVAPHADGSLPPSPHERAFYGEAARVLAPASPEELLEVVREAESRRSPIVPAGLGAHAYLGNPPPPGATVVSLRRLDRILRYEPGDFTVGVQAGLPLRTLRETLAGNRQEVPVDFSPGAGGTTGGLVAMAQPGLRRGRHGPLRAFVIGIHAVRCRPEGEGGPAIYKTGGMVVKNVAGYEVMKLLGGSLGTAGVILEVNFKLRPLPGRRAARTASFASRDDAWAFARSLRLAKLEPAAVWVLGGAAPAELRRRCPAAGEAAHQVLWLFEGTAERVAWQEGEAGSLLGEHRPFSCEALPAAEVGNALDFLSDFPWPGPQPREDLGMARLSVLPSEAPRLAGSLEGALAGLDEVAVETAGDALSGLVTVRWRVKADPEGASTAHPSAGPEAGPEAEPEAGPGTDPRSRPKVGSHRVEAPVAALMALLRDLGGAGTLLYMPPSVRRAHPHLLAPDPGASISRRVLRALDPAGLFSPGRILGREQAGAGMEQAWSRHGVGWSRLE